MILFQEQDLTGRFLMIFTTLRAKNKEIVAITGDRGKERHLAADSRK